MNIKKIVIKNFRSIDDEGIEIIEPDKINLLVGRNNSGKSNILRFIKLLGNSGFTDSVTQVNVGEGQQIEVNLVVDDHRNYSIEIPIEFSIQIEKLDAIYEESLLSIIPSDNFYVTYRLEKRGGEPGIYILKPVYTFIEDLPENIIRDFETNFVNKNGGTSGGSLDDAKSRVSRILKIPRQIGFPKVEYLGEYRKPTDNRELRGKMNEIVNTDYLNQANIAKKKLLCTYFKSVFDFDVDIKIPNLEKEIELVINDVQYPISSLGAGLQEVVLIAFMLVTTDADIICIDEPELHIHPGAQRELLNLVSTIENKVFFFATHSNHFLDYEVPNKKVYQLSKEGDRTKITVADNQSKYREILDDLGIRASEIYQTNGVIWVEGASDRIYIKKWIELLQPDLKEGLQYTFQYYGGKVLSHYSISDFEYEEYLNVLHINKNAYIVMDSDMTQAYSLEDLRDTKKRVISECENNSIGYWVTNGKEIENYLSDRVLTEYSGKVVSSDIYRPLESYYSSFDRNKKVHFSREVSEKITMADIQGNQDLEEKIKEIISAIKIWNK